MKFKKRQQKSRKVQRKEQRLAKKARKHEFFTKRKENRHSAAQKDNALMKDKVDDKKPQLQKSKNKKNRHLIDLNEEPYSKPPVKLKKNESLQDEQRKEQLIIEKEKKLLEKEMRKERIKKLKEDAVADDLEIKRMEKYLKLKNRNESSKKKFFSSDGLDYLLDVCDRTKLKETTETEKNFRDDNDSDFGQDFLKVTGKVDKLKKKKEIENSSDSDDAPEELPSSKAGVYSQQGKKRTIEDNTKDKDPSAEIRNKRMKVQDIDSGGINEDSDSDFSSGDDFSLNEVGSENDDSDENIDFDDEANSEADSTTSKEPLKKLPTKDKKGKLKIKELKKSDEESLHNDAEGKLQKKIKNSKRLILEKEKLTVPSLEKNPESNNSESSEKHLEQENFPFSEEDVASKEPEAEETDERMDDGTWEDIYGRKRDKEGNVLDGKTYLPPHLRSISSADGENDEKMIRLKKQLKGLLNRLAENNITSISTQVENLYMTHSRNEMNETLWSLFKESLIAETLTPERLVAEHAMLLAVLSANVGGEVSAHCLQNAVTYWHQLWNENPSVGDKRTNNLLLLLSFMYHFKLFHCTLLYDILLLLLDKIEEKAVELLLMVLKTVGFSLRKENAAKLKDIVVKVQNSANGSNATDGTRVRFLLDTVLAIKNNNMSKIPNYNAEYGEQIKKTFRACVRKGNYNAELKVTLEDLLKADERGRWWVVGSAWTGELPGEQEPVEAPRKEAKKKIDEGFSGQLLELAKKQRMNTDTRRTVFCVIMSSEDFLDAFEKLLKLGLKGPSEREIMNVLLHCLLQEKDYNPYYAYLARRFCTCNRRFQVILQFAVWDRIQELRNLGNAQVTNLAKFLGFLILEKSLALSVLKVVQFAELDKPAVRFIRQVLLSILLTESEESMCAVFSRVAVSKPLKLFREGLRLFLHHFVLKNSKAVEGTDMALVTTRVKMADSALSASERVPSLFN